eukprot:1160280-Pelagomonas_calceolata.AAC.8
MVDIQCSKVYASTVADDLTWHHVRTCALLYKSQRSVPPPMPHQFALPRTRRVSAATTFDLHMDMYGPQCFLRHTPNPLYIIRPDKHAVFSFLDSQMNKGFKLAVTY